VKRGAAALMISILLGLPACNSSSHQMLEQAEARWREGNYDDAIRLNTLLYQRDREGKFAPQALLNIGNIYYLNLRQLKDAVEYYSRLVDEYPGCPQEYKARLQLAAIYGNEIGDLNQAISEYDHILKMPDIENRQEIEFQRANTYFRKDDYAGALRELRRIEESGVTGHLADQISLKIGNIYQIQNRYDDAVPLFEKVSASPCIECRRRAIVHLMETYETQRDFDRAIKAIRKLDSPENDARIAKEVARLSERRAQVGSRTVLDWAAARQPRGATARSTLKSRNRAPK
jgi:tetratricopeptide (TPR) repeat protein